MHQEQRSVICKGCAKKFLVPTVDTGRQEVSADIGGDDNAAAFALICPFCMTHELYGPKNLQ